MREPDQLARLGELLAEAPYRAVRYLGRGGMSEVYVVRHEYVGRDFALKVLRSRFESDPQAIDRMRVEAQATARIQHPNIVQVIDFWVSARGQPCMVMEYLEGRTLAQLLSERRRLPVAEAILYTLQILSALSAAHSIGIVHRDIKPENLFIQEFSGHEPILKVLDFGLARVLPGSRGAPSPLFLPTATGAIVGSPRFVSPEGELGSRVDQRADVFSSGVVLYVMLTGRGPFDQMTDWVEQMAHPDPPSLHRGPEVSPELDRVVLRAIRLSRDERHQSADEFAAELKRCLPRQDSRL